MEEYQKGIRKWPSYRERQDRKDELIAMLRAAPQRRQPTVTFKSTRLINVQKLARVAYFTQGRRLCRPWKPEEHESIYSKDISKWQVGDSGDLDVSDAKYTQLHESINQDLPSYLRVHGVAKARLGQIDRIYISPNEKLKPESKIKNWNTKQDPEYYTLVAGRPIHTKKLNKRKYLGLINSNLQKKLTSAVIRDERLRHEEQGLRGISRMQKTRNEIMLTLKNLNEFLVDDLKKCWGILQSTNSLYSLNNLKQSQIVAAQTTLNKLTEAFRILDHNIKYSRMCKTLLDGLPPEYWKSKYREVKEKYQQVADLAANNAIWKLSLFKMTIPIGEPYIESVVLRLANAVRNLGPPAIYFKHPAELLAAIEGLQAEALIALQTLNNMKSRLQNLKILKEKLETENTRDLKVVDMVIEESIKELKSKVKPLTRGSKSDAIIDKYWKSVGMNEELFRAIIHLRFIYDEFIGKKGQTTDVVEMLNNLVDEVMKTEMKVTIIPLKEREILLEYVSKREEMRVASGLEAMEVKRRADQLLTSLQLRPGGRDAQASHPPPHAHPPKPRSKPHHKQILLTGAVRPETPINRRMMKRIFSIFEPTEEDEAFVNVVEYMESTYRTNKLSPFTPGILKTQGELPSIYSESECLPSSDEELLPEEEIVDQETFWQLPPNLKKHWESMTFTQDVADFFYGENTQPTK